MKVILTQDVQKLGNKGDVVDVAKGYARNYLIPQNVAILATRGAEKQAELLKQSRQAKQAKLKVTAEELAQKLASQTVEISAKVRENGKLFGSVGVQNIVIAINNQFETNIDKADVLLENPIKEIGESEVSVVLHEEVTQPVTISVVSEEA